MNVKRPVENVQQAFSDGGFSALKFECLFLIFYNIAGLILTAREFHALLSDKIS